LNLSDFISEITTALEPVFKKLVETNHTALVLLSHVVGDSGTTDCVGTNQDQVELIVLFDCWNRSNFKVLICDFLKLAVELSFLIGQLVSQLRDLLLGTCRSNCVGSMLSCGLVLIQSLLFGD
jgi:hypothetical protein